MLFVPVKLGNPNSYDPSKLSETVDLVPTNLLFHPDSYVSGYLDFEVDGRQPGTIKAFICPAGKRLNHHLYKSSTTSVKIIIDKDATRVCPPQIPEKLYLSDHPQTQIAFVMSPHLTDLKDKILEQYLIHS